MKVKPYSIISRIALIAILILILSDNINVSKTRAIGFDDAYNAQVAKHFAETGIYAVTYPDEIVFYNTVTTGPTLLLGTALLYKFFGISNITTNLIPMLYGLGVLILIYEVAMQILETKWKCVLSILGVILYLGFSTWYRILSTVLLGEIGALFFTLYSIFCIIKYFKTTSTRYVIVSGALLAFSFVSKTSQICIVLVFMAMFLFDIIWKRRCKIKGFLYYLTGFMIGMVVWELFKFIQYKGNVSKVIQWWIDEKSNVFRQTGTEHIFGNFNWLQISKRLSYFKDIFSLKYYVIFIAMLIPFVVFVFYYFVDKRDKQNAGISSILIMGMGGESLLIYFILFGSEGLMYARRLAVYSELIVIFCICMFLIVVDKAFNSEIKKSVIYFSVIVFSVCLFSSRKYFISQFKTYINKESMASVEYKSIDEMRNEIVNLQGDVTIYTYGWWQAPEVGLFVDYKFHDIYENVRDQIKLNGNENYFLVGSVIAAPWDWNGSCLEWLKQYYTVEEIFHSPSWDRDENYTLYKINDKVENG